MNPVSDSSGESTTRPADPAGGEAANPIIESPSGGALWRDYLTSILSKPIIREEVHDEVQTAA
jgi:hypothetical protein